MFIFCIYFLLFFLSLNDNSWNKSICLSAWWVRRRHACSRAGVHLHQALRPEGGLSLFITLHHSGPVLVRIQFRFCSWCQINMEDPNQTFINCMWSWIMDLQLSAGCVCVCVVSTCPESWPWPACRSPSTLRGAWTTGSSCASSWETTSCLTFLPWRSGESAGR